MQKNHLRSGLLWHMLQCSKTMQEFVLAKPKSPSTGSSTGKPAGRRKSTARGRKPAQSAQSPGKSPVTAKVSTVAVASKASVASKIAPASETGRPAVEWPVREKGAVGQKALTSSAPPAPAQVKPVTAGAATTNTATPSVATPKNIAPKAPEQTPGDVTTGTTAQQAVTAVQTNKETARVATAQPAAILAPQTKGMMNMTDAMKTAKTYAEEATTHIQGAVSDMNERTKSALEKSSKTMEEFGELTKGNFEAVVESSKIAAKGVEKMNQGAAEFGRKSFEKTSATFKSFAGVKSPTELFQLQSELLTSVFDSFASEAAKTSEALLKLANDASQPISNRVSVVTEKMKSIAA